MAATASKDLKIPGEADGNVLRASFVAPQLTPEQRVYFYMDSHDNYIGVLVNGRFLRRHHHMMGRLTYLDVTPYVKPGARNDIAIAAWDENPKRGGDVKEVKLFIYDHPLSQVQMKTAKK